MTTPSRELFGHPRGLATLFFTEMWERFGFYGMRAILILFMTADVAKGGLGFDVAKAGVIYGVYTAMVYFMSVPGGWAADRIFGQRRAVLAGGILITLGQFSLGAHFVPFFYAGLVLLVCGTGLLKPSVSTMVGQLYAQGDRRRDSGFSIFYMGINLGGFLSPLVCGYIGQRINWNLGFAVAGLGMIAGLVQFRLGWRHLGTAGLPPARPEGIGRKAILAAGGVAILIGLLSLTLRTSQGLGNAMGLLLLGVAVGVFTWLLASREWTHDERNRIAAIAVLFVAACLFFSASEQQGSTMNLFGDRNAGHHWFGYEFPSSWFQSLSSLFVITLAPVFAWLWIRMGRREPSSFIKFCAGLVLAGLGFAALGLPALASNKVHPGWVVLAFFIQTCGELCLGPVGLSVMTKLAPARIVSLMMGVWFLSISVGNYVGGRLASLWDVTTPATLFNGVAAATIIAGILLALVARPLRNLTGRS